MKAWWPTIEDGKPRMGSGIEGAGWVLLSEAEAEIEKARQANVNSYDNGYKQGLRDGSVVITNTKEANDAARADERERIADMLEREMNAPDSKDHAAEWNRVTRDALRYAITCIRNPRPAKPFCVCYEYFERHGKHHPNCGCEPKDAQEPKPLEKLFFTDSEWDGQLYRKFNVLVDVVNELRGKK